MSPATSRRSRRTTRSTPHSETGLKTAVRKPDATSDVLNSLNPPPDTGLETGRLFDAAPEALLVVRADAIVAVNASAGALVGAHLVGTPMADLVLGWSHGMSTAPFSATLELEDGVAVPVEVRVRSLDDDEAVVSLRDARELLAGRDATARLFEAEARYRGLVEQIPAVVYSDAGYAPSYVSPQIEHILGVTPQAYIEDPDMWLNMVHPDDRDWVAQQSDAFLAGEGGDLDDYRMVRPDGRVVWVRDRAFAHRDGTGKVILEQGLLFDVTELKEAEARIAQMAHHDSLTGLANRKLFEESLQLAVERAKRDHTAIAVLYLDLDNFKELNDTLGHHAGDLLLVGLAARLKTCTRDVDLVARHGGDEFLLLLADLEPSGADAIIRLVLGRVSAAMEQPLDLDGTAFRAHGSIGVSRYPADAYDAESLLRNADAAMYHAKRSEPGSHRFFEPGA